jgi:hypothetical protein
MNSSGSRDAVLSSLLRTVAECVAPVVRKDESVGINQLNWIGTVESEVIVSGPFNITFAAEALQSDPR